MRGSKGKLVVILASMLIIQIASFGIMTNPVFAASSDLIGPWSSTTDLPRPLTGHGSVATANALYVIGGNAFDRPGGIHCSPCGATTEVNLVPINSDGSLGSWQSTTSLPEHRQGTVPLLIDNRIYVVGGHPADGLAEGRTTAWYAEINPDGTLGPWVSTTPLPVPKFSYAAAAFNNFIYLIGGSDDGFVSTNTVRYAKVKDDGTLDTWNTSTPLPKTIDGGGAVVFNDMIYLFGGNTHVGRTGETISDVYSTRINPDGSLGAWTKIRDLPRLMANFGTIFKDSTIFLIGGSDHLGNVYSNVIRSSINADGSLSDWVEDNSVDINGVEQPRSSLGAALSGNRIYVTGGSSPNPGRTSTVFFASMGGVPVGGDILPIDMTSLFVAGALTNVYWVLPILVAIGGAVIAVKRTRK